MKVTESQLKHIVKEELGKVLEVFGVPAHQVGARRQRRRRAPLPPSEPYAGSTFQATPSVPDRPGLLQQLASLGLNFDEANPAVRGLTDEDLATMLGALTESNDQ